MSWEQARSHASPIRFTVFCEEQGVPREIELDEHDSQSIHAIAYEGTDAVGTARLLPDGHIGRMAVLKDWRGRGIGGLMLQKLMERAKARGDREIVLSAQAHAVPFYRANGFMEDGSEYLEAGIRHQEMRRKL